MARLKSLESSNGWIKFCQALLYPLTRLIGQRNYVGMERLNRPGPMLLVGNHISHLDPMYDVVMIRKAGRNPHVLAKASLWKIPVVGRVLAGSGQIPVERGGQGAGQQALVDAQQHLADGNVVLIYPEGSVTKEPNFWPMKPKPGMAALALSGDIPVIPVVHWGTQAAYNSYAEGKKLRLIPRQKIQVFVGPDIDLSAYRGKGTDTRAIRDVSMVVMKAISDLLAEIRQEKAPTELFDPKKAQRLAQRAQADSASKALPAQQDSPDADSPGTARESDEGVR